MRYANYSGTMNSLLRNETKKGNRKYVVISRHVYIYAQYENRIGQVIIICERTTIAMILNKLTRILIITRWHPRKNAKC